MREVRILYLEDNKRDAELVTEILTAMPLRPKVDHVDSGASYQEKINRNRYDLILSDYSIPGYSGMEALRLAHDLTPDTPFIFFSGTIGEDVAVDSLIQGATDYVVKQRPARLTAAITRALENAELRRQQRANQDSLQFQANILNNVTDGVIATDIEGRIAYWNPGAELIFHRSPKQMMMKPLADSGLELVHGGFRDLMERARELGKASDTLSCRTSEGQTVWVSASSQRLTDSSKRFLGYLLILNDITERKSREEEVTRLHADFESRLAARTADLTEANEDLQRFGYSMSHDLSGPIRAVGGNARVLEEDFGSVLGEEGLYAVGRIRAAAARMDQLSKGLLRLARLSATPLELVQVDLSSIVKAVRSDLSELDRARNVSWRIEEGLTVHADELLIRSLIENLLGNAWKYTSERANAVIEFGMQNTDRGRAYFVRDNGIGFDQDHAKALFEPFLRLHSDDEYPGTGVGLSTAARIAERHNGQMWAVGTPGTGATFYFTLGGTPKSG